MVETKKGNLVISSIPTQYALDLMIVYLMGIVKNVPRKTLEQKLIILPTILFKNIEEERGLKIVAELMKMGVIAKFVDPKAPPETMVETPEEEERIDTVGKVLQELLNRSRPGVTGAARKAREALERYNVSIRDSIKEFKEKRI